MTAYSFKNIVASITGPGGSFDIGSDSGSAEEGISTAMAGDKNTMTIGAGGDGMHNLHASKAGTITIRLLKNSTTNAKLSNLYALQTQDSGILHGQNTIVIRDFVRGDVITGKECAFRKFPDNTYGTDGASQEWVFDCIKLDQKLGSGTPSL